MCPLGVAKRPDQEAPVPRPFRDFLWSGDGEGLREPGELLHGENEGGTVDIWGAEGHERCNPNGKKSAQEDDPLSLPKDPEVLPQIDLVIL